MALDWPDRCSLSLKFLCSVPPAAPLPNFRNICTCLPQLPTNKGLMDSSFCFYNMSAGPGGLLDFQTPGIGGRGAQGFLPLCSFGSFSEGPPPPRPPHLQATNGLTHLGGGGRERPRFPCLSTSEALTREVKTRGLRSCPGPALGLQQVSAF